jgi:threonine/homoserine/homoserine lactone efflux protein
MNLAILLTYCGALFVAAAIPGPGMTAVVARALGSSFSETMPMGLGLILGDLVYLTAVILGLSVLAHTFGMAFMMIKFAGAAYLAFLAYKLWTSGIAIADVHAERRTSFAMTFLSGLLITLGNPKTMLFYLALVPSILDLKSITLADYAVLIVSTLLVLTVVLVPYILLAARIRLLMKQPKPLRVLNRVAASFLAGSAALIAMRAN